MVKFMDQLTSIIPPRRILGRDSNHGFECNKWSSGYQVLLVYQLVVLSLKHEKHIGVLIEMITDEMEVNRHMFHPRVKHKV